MTPQLGRVYAQLSNCRIGVNWVERGPGTNDIVKDNIDFNTKPNLS